MRHSCPHNTLKFIAKTSGDENDNAHVSWDFVQPTQKKINLMAPNRSAIINSPNYNEKKLIFFYFFLLKNKIQVAKMLTKVF